MKEVKEGEKPSDPKVTRGKTTVNKKAHWVKIQRVNNPAAKCSNADTDTDTDFSIFILVNHAHISTVRNIFLHKDVLIWIITF